MLPSSSGTNTPCDANIDGRTTPSIVEVTVNDNAASVASNSGDDDNTSRGDSKKSVMQQGDREEGAFAYRAEEHLTLLSFISLTLNLFNMSETSLEWRAVHANMVGVYQGTPAVNNVAKPFCGTLQCFKARNQGSFTF